MSSGSPSLAEELTQETSIAAYRQWYRIDSPGVVRMYSLAEEPLPELSTWLDETRRFWSEQLGAFKDHVEQSTR